MTCGLALRSSMGMPTALGQPSSTSVWHPTSSWGTPRYIPAISPRSSTTPTRSAARSSVPLDSAAIISRSSVVFPAPGGAAISVLSKPLSLSAGTSCHSPRTCRLIRTVADDMSRSASPPSCRTATVPHSPIRKPPRPIRYPFAIVSAAAYREYPVTASHSCSRSACVTLSLGSSSLTSISPSHVRMVIGRPVRSRNSSASAFRCSGARRAACCHRAGSSAAACSYRPTASPISIPPPPLLLPHSMTARPGI